MRKTIAYIGAYAFYYLGHWTYKAVRYFDSEALYILYKWFINKSFDIQEWGGGNKPWGRP